MQTRNRSTFTFSQVRNGQDLIEVTIKLIKYTCKQSLTVILALTCSPVAQHGYL